MENGSFEADLGLFHDLPTLGNEENFWAIMRLDQRFRLFSATVPRHRRSFGLGTQNHYPYGFTYPAFVGTPLDAHGGIVGSNISMGAVQQDLAIPNTVVWSTAVERQITQTMTASLGYSGTHSSNLIIVGGNTGDTSYTADVNLFPGRFDSKSSV